MIDTNFELATDKGVFLFMVIESYDISFKENGVERKIRTHADIPLDRIDKEEWYLSKECANDERTANNITEYPFKLIMKLWQIDPFLKEHGYLIFKLHATTETK